MQDYTKTAPVLKFQAVCVIAGVSEDALHQLLGQSSPVGPAATLLLPRPLLLGGLLHNSSPSGAATWESGESALVNLGGQQASWHGQ